MNASITSRLRKGCLVWGLLVLPLGCATTDQLESLKKELSEKVVASQEEQRANMEAQTQKTEESLEAKIGQVKSEVVQKTEAQEQQLTSRIEDLRQELFKVRDQVSHLSQIESEVKEIKSQTRYIQTGFKDNLKGQAALLREELEMIEKTLKGMESSAERSP